MPQQRSPLISLGDPAQMVLRDSRSTGEPSWGEKRDSIRLWRGSIEDRLEESPRGALSPRSSAMPCHGSPGWIQAPPPRVHWSTDDEESDGGWSQRTVLGEGNVSQLDATLQEAHGDDSTSPTGPVARIVVTADQGMEVSRAEIDRTWTASPRLAALNEIRDKIATVRAATPVLDRGLPSGQTALRRVLSEESDEVQVATAAGVVWEGVRVWGGLGLGWWVQWVRNWAIGEKELAWAAWVRLANTSREVRRAEPKRQLGSMPGAKGDLERWTLERWRESGEAAWNQRAELEEALIVTEEELTAQRMRLQGQLAAEQVRHQKVAREHYLKLDAMLTAEKKKKQRAVQEVTELEMARQIAKTSVLEAEAAVVVDQKIEEVIAGRSSMRHSVVDEEEDASWREGSFLASANTLWNKLGADSDE